MQINNLLKTFQHSEFFLDPNPWGEISEWIKNFLILTTEYSFTLVYK